MNELWTDADVTPKVCNLDLAAALAYDEILAGIIRPNQSAAAIDRAIYAAERLAHQRKLRELKRLYGPNPRYQLPQLPSPGVVPVVFSAR